MSCLSRLILRYAGIVVISGLLLSCFGAYYSILLYENLRTDLEELLPTQARSVIDLDEVTHRLESVDNLAVLVFSKDTEASKLFVTHLAEQLGKAPKNVIASVEYKIDEELRFFRVRRALYLDLIDLTKARNYVRDRIEYERALYNPLNIFREEEIPEPQLDLRAMKQKYEKKVSAYSRFPDGYYATSDETKRAILVNVPGRASGITGAYRLKSYVEKTIAELNPASFSPNIEIKYTGGVQNTIEEQSAVLKDLGVSSIMVICLVSLGMLIFFKAFFPTLALVGSLFMGTLWTFGIAYFTSGYLNANSAFLGSIIIGNGINFGIIFLARYMEERSHNKNHARSVYIAMTQTSKATWTAALAAGVSYGSLVLTSFRGFKQFGVIGLIGMMLCWITAFTLLPALLTVFERIWPLHPKYRSESKAPVASGLANLISRFPALIWGISFLLTLASLATFFRYDRKIIETDLTKLRNKKSMEEGSAYLSKYLDEIFQRYLAPVVMLPKNRHQTQEIAEALKEEKESEGRNSTIISVQTLDDFIPTHQAEKIQILKEIKKILPPRMMHRLAPEDQKLIYEFLTDEAFKPMHMGELPKLILNKFTEKDGSVGKLVLVEPPLGNALAEGDQLIGFVRKLRKIADSIAPGTPIAGALPVSADLVESITNDGPRATFFSFLAVFLLVVFFFRNLKTISLVLFALILGVLWMSGVVLGFGWKINFLNFIALPITFGIGVDYGVNIFQRYREEKKGGILRVIRNTGGAVGLCSFTTIVGYSSLLLAENQAFVSFGRLAVLGEVTCLTAAVVALPAYLVFRDRGQNGKK